MCRKSVLAGVAFLLSAVVTVVVGSPSPAPVPKTGQINSYGIRDDGALEMGVAWPDPRFTDQGNGTIMDNLTGLIWLKNAGCFGVVSWSTALNDANALASGNCGLTDGSTAGDWRLPNVREMHSLVDFRWYNPSLPLTHPFSNVQTDFYWTSTSVVGLLPDDAWHINLNTGGISFAPKSYTENVWPVRGETGGVASVPRTGQTLCYDTDGTVIDCAGTGQDAEYQYGVAWPDPRLTDHGNGSVTDNLTGLVWLKNANCFSTRRWTYALSDANKLASGSCGLTDGSREGDWRLPNARELFSLIDFGHIEPALPDGHPFTNTHFMPLWWTSTTYPLYNGDSAWTVGIMSSTMTSTEKNYSQPVWPVRGKLILQVFIPLAVK